MKNTARSARIYDCLEPLGARGVLGRKRNVDVQHGAISASTAIEWELLVWYFESHTESGSQTFGVFRRTGSVTPASSLLRTTSSNVAPTATISVSSSDKAI